MSSNSEESPKWLLISVAEHNYNMIGLYEVQVLQQVFHPLEYFARVQCGSTLSNLFKLDRY